MYATHPCVVFFLSRTRSHAHTRRYIRRRRRHRSLALVAATATTAITYSTAIVAAGYLSRAWTLIDIAQGDNLVSLLIPSFLRFFLLVYWASKAYLRSNDICTAVILLVITTSLHYLRVPDVWQHHCRCGVCSCPHVTGRSRVPSEEYDVVRLHLNFLGSCPVQAR